MLNLKIGAPVILIRNMPGNLYNGQKGVVIDLDKEKGPTINFEGKIVTIEPVKFEHYDPSAKRVLATRLQYPLKLAFALTVHRAQGRTLRKVEIDCFSFFAPGQMGVAVGRAVNKAGLRIINYNREAAKLKHPREVYDFYAAESQELMDDLTCCKHEFDTSDTSENTPPNQENLDNVPSNPQEPYPARAPIDVVCPWSVDEFLRSESGKSFMPGDVTEGFTRRLQVHAGMLFGNVKEVLKKKTKTNDDFARVMKQANGYLTSEIHATTSSENLPESPKPQKLSTKLYQWILHKEIQSSSSRIVKQQTEKFEGQDTTTAVSDVGKSKIRYLAGACIHKIVSRLSLNVLRKIGKPGTKSRAQRDWDFRRYRLLRSLRITEEEAMKVTAEPDSMHEIQNKQGPSRGLLHVSDNVFLFFMDVNAFLRKLLSTDAFHLYVDSIYALTRTKLFTNEDLLDQWIDLFSVRSSEETDALGTRDDEVFVDLLTELYELVVEYFLRIAVVDGLHEFKSIIPRKKKQALRSKVTALCDREAAPKKKAKTEESSYICPTCKELLEEEPREQEDQSIACDGCNQWYDFRCQGLTGNEQCLKRKASRWICSACSVKAKGRSLRISNRQL